MLTAASTFSTDHVFTNSTMKKVNLLSCPGVYVVRDSSTCAMDPPSSTSIESQNSFADFRLLLEEEEEEDGMDEIDTENIVAGRTRGKNINWAEADQKAKEAGDDLDDDDDEEDEDFEDEESKDKDAMEE